jgi:hypothetical protein
MPIGVMPMDTPISRAHARKEVLVREIEQRQRDVEENQRQIGICQAEMRDIETFIMQYARFSGEEEVRTNTEINGSQHTSAEQNEASDIDGLVSQERFEADIRQVLVDNGRPMQRGRLISALHSLGLRVGGTNELKNFGTKIWKARARFVNIPSEGYWPRDIACPAVDYQPGSSQADLGHKDMFSSTDRY